MVLRQTNTMPVGAGLCSAHAAFRAKRLSPSFASAPFHRGAALHRITCPPPSKREAACAKKVFFDTRSNETHCVGLSFEGAAARRSALAYARTFASREVFSPTYTPPEKMIEISLRLRTQTLRGFVTLRSFSVVRLRRLDRGYGRRRGLMTSQMPQGAKKPACTARGLLFARILSDLT